jgi:putative flippase GtrA
MNNNSESHFNPIRDSIAIYGAIIKSFVMFSISSILSFLVDISLFSLLLYVGFGNKSADGILFATIFARMGSSILNYLVNRNCVFKNKDAYMKTLIKYLILCTVQMLCSAGLVIALFLLTGMNEVFIKIVVDTVLFFISFRIQDSFVFSKNLVRNK